MKIHVLSDLHIEFQPFNIPNTDADVVVLAGDIHVREKGVIWAIENIPSKPVIYILGNHEYYGAAYPKLIQKLKNITFNTNVNILENDLLKIEDVTFLGCTLWTNFEIFGNPRIAGYEASQKMNDFKRIRVSPEYRKFRSLDAAIVCRKSINWLKSNLNNTKTVIITHHAPSQKSLPEKYKEETLSATYANNFDDFVAGSGALVWIHGHVHNQLNYKIGSTRIFCNPRGYPEELNLDFNPELVIEV